MTDETIRKLRDPVAVHVAMLRGQIAVPPLAELLHVYGATFSDLGDLFHLDYLPKGEAIAKAIGLPVIAIREPNEEECERIVESATRMLHSGDTFPEIGRRMFNAVREVMK